MASLPVRFVGSPAYSRISFAQASSWLADLIASADQPGVSLGRAKGRYRA